jgi:hypothetical protein
MNKYFVCSGYLKYFCLEARVGPCVLNVYVFGKSTQVETPSGCITGTFFEDDDIILGFGAEDVSPKLWRLATRLPGAKTRNNNVFMHMNCIKWVRNN